MPRPSAEGGKQSGAKLLRGQDLQPSGAFRLGIGVQYTGLMMTKHLRMSGLAEATAGTHSPGTMESVLKRRD